MDILLVYNQYSPLSVSLIYLKIKQFLKADTDSLIVNKIIKNLEVIKGKDIYKIYIEDLLRDKTCTEHFTSEFSLVKLKSCEAVVITIKDEETDIKS